MPQIQAGLAQVIQKSGENVSEYGLRVTKLLQKAIELINETYEPVVVPGIIQGPIGTAIECFKVGLDKKVTQEMINP